MQAVLRCSGAAARNGCPGSVQLQMLYPDNEESEAAREGTASHEVGAKKILAAAVARATDHKPGDLAENGVVLDAAMIEGAQLFADDVQQVMRETGVFTPRVEEYVAVPRVHELAGGTPDCALFAPGLWKLYVWDYKYGFEVVDVYENAQLIEYASGLLTALGFDGLTEQRVTVELRIVQPRAFHRDGPVRSWTVNAADLRPYVNQSRASAEEALTADPRTVAGRHCLHCSGRHVCTTLQRSAYSGCEYVGRVTPHQLTPSALGLELWTLRNISRLLQARISGLEAQAIETAAPLPYFRIEHGKGHDEWTVPTREVLQLGLMYEKDLAKPQKAITPKQAKALGVPSELVDAYSHTPRRSLKLIEDNGDNARRIFAIDAPKQ